MVWCSGCDNLIDSDDDPECFTKNGNGPIWCTGCRGDYDDGEEPPQSREDYLADKADAANDEAKLHGEDV